MSKIRISAKGLIFSKGKLLLIKNQSSSDVWYTLPGGGANFKESLIQALAREVIEETGIEIEIERLFAIREYIGENHEFSSDDSNLHFVEHIFLCNALGEDIQTSIADSNQVAVEWVDATKMDRINLYPKILPMLVVDYATTKKYPVDVYLGDIN